ncbi:hypothetical protein E1B28_001519 [Marasmius oreades]|uniref:Uncharacterized protein n=1 Tax=Marasmius oreades TaxID=181124 RepID=A0A9P7V3K1_9AGAR|nr:uncharacterized protein E1B28_001519 [Marasmius oreades]KAG7099699.1 hypothetical protein E1B28_001519 [Marasmius oreades]
MAGNIPLDVAGVLSVWFETLIYGIYTCLFLSSFYMTLRKGMLHSRPSKIFFVATLVMWINCSAHVAVNLYRLLRGYVYLRETVGPTNYFNDLGRPDKVVAGVLNALMTWMGDSLVIYRCYLVWDSNIWVVILPISLLIVSIISNCVALYMFTKVPLGTIFGPALVHWMNTIYATAFAQNALTSSLIAYRLWKQEKNSRRAGIRSQGSSSNLIPVARIVVESAALYMALLLCLIVLYIQNNNGQFVLQEASPPAVGIVFCSISVRVSMRSHKMWRTTARATETHLSFDNNLVSEQSVGTGGLPRSISNATVTRTSGEQEKGAGTLNNVIPGSRTTSTGSSTEQENNDTP